MLVQNERRTCTIVHCHGNSVKNTTLPWQRNFMSFVSILIIYYDYDMDVHHDTKHMGIIILLHVQKYLSIYKSTILFRNADDEVYEV